MVKPPLLADTTLPWRAQRLHTRIGLALGAVFVSLALVLAGALGEAAKRHVLSLSLYHVDTLGQQMARQLSEGMHQFSREVVAQSLRDRFRDPASSVDALRHALDSFQQTHPDFAFVSVVDAATGRVVAATGGIFEGGDAKGRPTFEEGLKGPFLGDVHDAVRLAQLLPRPESGEPLRFLDVAAPVLDAEGRVVRVIAAHVSWQWTQRLREEILGPLHERRNIEVFLVDTAGKVVLQGADDVPVGTDLRALTAAVQQPAKGVRWPDGKTYLTVVEATRPHGSFAGFGWKVIVRQNMDTALGPFNGMRWAFFLGALVLGLAAAAMAWIVTGRIVRPVRQLAEAAAQASTGLPITSLAQGHGVGEVSTVHTALQKLVADAREQADASWAKDRQFTALADSLPCVVWQSDAHGSIDHVNKEWIRAGALQGAFHVADLAHLIHPDDRDSFRQAWQTSQASGDDLSVRCRLHPEDRGGARWFDIVARAVRAGDGKPVRWVGTLFDVHEMVSLAQNTQRALNEERAARAEAERLTRLKDEFLATVSHELRSPLSAITGWSDILARKSDADPMLTKATAVIRRNAALQARLINDLLDLNAVMAGKMVLDTLPLDLSKVVKDVVLSHLHAAQSKGVDLACPALPPLAVSADLSRITQVVSNLVSNALKFTDPGGRIDVLTWASEGDAVLRISDTGRGIAPEFLPFVFDRLRQEDASITRRAGGLGIGLAISRGLVELHQGRIQAESAGPGHGSTFTITLPLLASEPDVVTRPADLAETDDLPSGLDGVRVLLVDDESDAREVAHVALSSLGAQVRLAASAQEALAVFKPGGFDVIVSDIGMPVMDGLSLVRAIRALPGGGKAEVAAVALTAFAMEADRQAGLAAGFQAYVSKPISLRRLAESIVHARAACRAAAAAPASALQQF